MVDHDNRTLVILHSGTSSIDRPDEIDTLTQVQEMATLAENLGWQVESVSYSLGEVTVCAALEIFDPAIVLNLVESVYGSDAMVHHATALLDRLHIPYTGASTSCLRRTASKPRVKRLLRKAGIATPAWQRHEENATSAPTRLPPGQYIIKSETEHCSYGMDASSIVDAESVPLTLMRRANMYGGAWFAEQYIEGREFNVTLLATAGGVEVLPVAEINFEGLPEGLPRIVDYAAKWDVSSPGYHNTPRAYPSPQGDDAGLLKKLADAARACWNTCELKGYARIDFRVDAQDTPWVIDVNPNPCLSADAGFMAATAQAGFTPETVLERILADALNTVQPTYPSRTPVG